MDLAAIFCTIYNGEKYKLNVNNFIKNTNIIQTKDGYSYEDKICFALPRKHRKTRKKILLYPL